MIFDEYLVMVAITFDTLKYANRLKAAGAESRNNWGRSKVISVCSPHALVDFSLQIPALGFTYALIMGVAVS